MKARKFLFVIIFLCSNLALCFSQNKYEGKKIIVNSPEVQNLGEEKDWIVSSVQLRLKENFQNYLKFSLLADSNEINESKNLIKAAEQSLLYDDEQLNLLGNYDFADYIFNSKISKFSSGYFISGTLENIKNGTEESVGTSFYKTYDELFINKGAVDELTLSLCKKLGVPLLISQEAELSSVNINADLEKLKTITTENIAEYERRIKENKNKIVNLINLTKDELAKKLEIEAENALYEEKLLQEKKYILELAEREKKLKEEENKSISRSAELKSKIQSKSEKVEAEYEKLKKKNQALEYSGKSVLEKINILESKKKTLVEIRNSVEREVRNLKQNAEIEAEKSKQKILSQPFLSIEINPDTGLPYEEAIEGRRNEAETFRKKLLADAEAASEVIVKTAAPSCDKLLKEIYEDQKKIKSDKTVNSFSDELRIFYGAYDGSLGGWNVTVSLFCEGFLIHEEKIFLNYEKITGEKSLNLAEATRAEKKEFSENIEMYNSLFTKGINILYYEMNYSVEAAADEEPSSYIFNLKELKVYSVETGICIQEKALNSEKKLALTPAYNLKNIYSADVKKYDKYVLDAEKKEMNRNKKKEFIDECLFNKTHGVGERTGAAFGVDLIFASSPKFPAGGFDMGELFFLTADYSFFGKDRAYVFAGATLFATENKGNSFGMLAELGVSYCPFKDFDYMQIYAKTGIGFATTNYVAGGGCITRFAAGFDFAVINIEYQVDYIIGKGFSDGVSFGLSIQNGPWGFVR